MATPKLDAADGLAVVELPAGSADLEKITRSASAATVDRRIPRIGYSRMGSFVRPAVVTTTVCASVAWTHTDTIGRSRYQIAG
jgi:hypothetical protein